MDWRLSHLSDDIRMCVSELVTNAITHAVGVDCAVVTIRIVHTQATRVVVEVEDSDPTLPQFPAVNCGPPSVAEFSLETHGRGLLMVVMSSDGQEVRRRFPFGKVVSCWWDLGARGLGDPIPVRRDGRNSPTRSSAT
ncbi:hypothetical protein GCM10023205_82130 [Yinghuangia aomiensis]|uniref:Histidine kinase/HSP90-like ATPase domain-containing protein n=2 Tax=Yinghuangia aomiensis TaxID=676205 RepID=A0ABP9IF78_9ACTN